LREIVLDTETTGLDPYQGHRLIEIGCIELLNRIPSGQTFHCYLNPERDVPAEAVEIHGLSAEQLKDKPLFAEVADDLIAFIGDAPLVAHNASFDLGFLNAELERAGKALLARERLVDTLLLARRKHPAASNRLDDLCVRYGIDNSRRTRHGALLDAELLAEVYLELIGARQAQLVLVDTGNGAGGTQVSVTALRLRPAPLAPRLTADERDAHLEFVATLGETAIWRDYLAIDRAAGSRHP
jgi:DNA polymerase-3 subunit epsilon